MMRTDHRERPLVHEQVVERRLTPRGCRRAAQQSERRAQGLLAICLPALQGGLGLWAWAGGVEGTLSPQRRQELLGQSVGRRLPPLPPILAYLLRVMSIRIGIAKRR
jgi:hypothetical protein